MGVATTPLFPPEGMNLPKLATLHGSFDGNTSNDPTGVKGKGFSVAHSGSTGIITITTDVPYKHVISLGAIPVITAGTILLPYFTEADPANKTFKIAFITADGNETPTDPQTTLRCNFTLVLSRSGLPV